MVDFMKELNSWNLAGDDPRRSRCCISYRLFHLWLGNVNLHDKFDKSKFGGLFILINVS